MLKKNLVFFVSMVAVLFTSQAMAGDKIVNGIDANFPPFAYIDETGTPNGFDVEAITLIASDIGLEVSHKPIEWSSIVTSLVSEKIDIIASGMSITPERMKVVSFSIPYRVIKQVMVTKEGSTLSINDILKGNKVVGVQQGTSEAKWLKVEAEKQGWNLKLRFYDSSPLAVEDVLNGRIDAAAMDDAPAEDAVSKKDVAILGTFGMHSEEFGYAVRKEDKELLAKVNASLEKLMASPKWTALLKKYNLDK